MINTGDLSAHLRQILGEEGFVLFCQELGGIRVYVPYKLKDDNEIVQAIGAELAEKLSRAMAPATIRVPLAKRERALYWRGKGLSNARVGRKIGMTETGVTKLFGREDNLPDKPESATPPEQMRLF